MKTQCTVNLLKSALQCCDRRDARAALQRCTACVILFTKIVQITNTMEWWVHWHYILHVHSTLVNVLSVYTVEEHTFEMHGHFKLRLYSVNCKLCAHCTTYICYDKAFSISRIQQSEVMFKTMSSLLWWNKYTNSLNFNRSNGCLRWP